MHSINVKSTNVNSTNVNSTFVNSTNVHVNSTNVKSTNINGTDVNSTTMNSTTTNSTTMNSTNKKSTTAINTSTGYNEKSTLLQCYLTGTTATRMKSTPTIGCSDLVLFFDFTIWAGLGTPIGMLRSFLFFKKKRSVLFHSFPFFSRVFCLLATYETQKNAKNATFFCKERNRTQHSFAKNGKECENVPFFFQHIYRNIYRYI